MKGAGRAGGQTVGGEKDAACPQSERLGSVRTLQQFIQFIDSFLHFPIRDHCGMIVGEQSD